jgi:N-carbamoyl-L-amino-acid hydrolase
VLDGGAYDGPLGVVSALAALDLLVSRGFSPSRPLGVSVFVEEEGSRFGLACLGSRLASGAVSWDTARSLTDRSGVSVEDALAAASLSGPSSSSLLDGVTTFVELHVEQGRDLVDRPAAPIGVASGIWPHGRYRYEFRGSADHAGTTRMQDRADPMLTYAMTALAANKQARLADERATFGRVEVTPNSTNSVPSAVTAWLDARASSSSSLAELVGVIERQATERAARDGTSLTVTPESVSGAVTFSPELAARIAAPRGWPVIPTAAGHDAGILSAAGIETGRPSVRNPTGDAHSPAEAAATSDSLAGVEALADVLADLASDPVGDVG